MQGVSYAEVLEEVWQNERFTIFVGWHAPYAGELARFSDRLGAVVIGHGPEFPTIQVPAGWEWVSGSEWTVDLAWGEVDAEGWCYGKSFGSILLSIEKNCTCASASTTDVTRRRRWVRQRVCVAADAQLELQARVQHVAVERAYLQQSLRDRSTYMAELEAFEQERLKCFKVHYNNVQSKTKEMEMTLRRELKSLESLKAFLSERSSIELEHAKRMARFVDKFGSAHAALDEIAQVQSVPAPIDEPEQFINAACRAYQQMATMMNDFALLVSEPLIGDIQQHVTAVQDLIRQMMTQLPNLRTGLVSVEEQINAARAALDSTFQLLCTEVSFSIDKLTHELLHDAVATHSSVADTGAVGHDFWLAEHVYRSLVREAEKKLQEIVHTTHRQEKLVQVSLSKLRSLSYSTSKVFVHEQTQLWQETAAVLCGTGDQGDAASQNDPGIVFPKPQARERARSRTRTSSVESIGSADSASGRDEIDLQLPAFPAMTCLVKQALLRYADGAQVSQAASTGNMDGVEWRSAIVVWTLDRYLHVFDTDAGTLHGVLPLKPSRSFAMKECQVRPHETMTDTFELLYPSKLKSIFAFASTASSGSSNSHNCASLAFLALDVKERREWLQLLDATVEVESEDESQTVARALRLIAEADEDGDAGSDCDSGEMRGGSGLGESHAAEGSASPVKRYDSTGLRPEDGVAL